MTGPITRCESPDCVCSPTNTPQELVAPVASDPEGATGVPSARALQLMAAAWHDLRDADHDFGCVHTECWSLCVRLAGDILATPAGQRLAAIVDAAVAPGIVIVDAARIEAIARRDHKWCSASMT